MPDEGPRWNVGKTSLRSSKSRSPDTRTEADKDSQRRDEALKTKNMTDVVVAEDTPVRSRRTPTGTKRSSSRSSSRSSRDKKRTGEDLQNSGQPHSSRRRQDKLPSAPAPSPSPQGCGTVRVEECVDADNENKSDNKRSSKTPNTYREWAEEKRREDRERRDKIADTGSKYRKKSSTRAFNAKDWAEPELNAIAKSVVLADSQTFISDFNEFNEMKIGDRRNRISLALADMKETLSNFFLSGEEVKKFFTDVVELSSMRDHVQNQDIANVDKEFQDRFRFLQDKTSPILNSMRKARISWNQATREAEDQDSARGSDHDFYSDYDAGGEKRIRYQQALECRAHKKVKMMPSVGGHLQHAEHRRARPWEAIEDAGTLAEKVREGISAESIEEFGKPWTAAEIKEVIMAFKLGKATSITAKIPKELFKGIIQLQESINEEENNKGNVCEVLAGDVQVTYADTEKAEDIKEHKYQELANLMRQHLGDTATVEVKCGHTQMAGTCWWYNLTLRLYKVPKKGCEI